MGCRISFRQFALSAERAEHYLEGEGDADNSRLQLGPAPPPVHALVDSQAAVAALAWTATALPPLPSHTFAAYFESCVAHLRYDSYSRQDAAVRADSGGGWAASSQKVAGRVKARVDWYREHLSVKDPRSANSRCCDSVSFYSVTLTHIDSH